MRHATEPEGLRESRESTQTVVSRDGTTVAVTRLGSGPGLVVLHGAMETRASHRALATVLADDFTVYLVERRGLGLGYPFARDYDVGKEVGDVAAILEETGSGRVFGVSSGALVALQAALDLPSVRKVAVYEPALFLGGAPTDQLARYDDETAHGKTAAALVTGMIAAQMGPPIFRRIPRRLLESLVDKAMRSEDRKAKPDEVTMRRLAPTLHYDFTLVAEMSARPLERFRALQPETLLLGGSESPRYLKRALESLEQVLPHEQRVEFAGLDHGGSSDVSQMNRRGRPEIVARELRRFFAPQ